MYELIRINAGRCAPAHCRICGCFGYGAALTLKLMNKFSLQTTQPHMNLSRYLTVLRSAQLCKYTCGLYLFSCLVLLTPTSVEAQSHGVTLTGTVNETVALSIAPNSIQSDIDVDVVRTGSSVVQ
jgi:hypothetical protein